MEFYENIIKLKKDNNELCVYGYMYCIRIY